MMRPRQIFRLVSLLLFMVKLAALTEEAAYALQSGIVPPTNIHMDVELIVERLNIDANRDRGFIIVAIQSYGLANRLRVLATAFLAAQDSGRVLIVDWAPNAACGASFTDLFLPPQMWPLPWRNQVSLYSGDRHLLRNLTDYVNWSVPVIKLWAPLNANKKGILVWRPRGTILDSKRFLSTAEKVVLMRPGSFFAPRGTSCQEHYFRKRNFYRMLLSALQNDVQKWVDRISAYSVGKNGLPLSQHLLVGIHIRVHDEAHDWPVVAPQTTPSESSGNTGNDSKIKIVQEAQTFDAVASQSMFIEAMGALYSHINGIHFFVASNSEAAKQSLVDTFGVEIVSTINNSEYLNRSSAIAIKRALVDFIMLSESSLIVHGYGSSFGEEAAAVNMIPSVRIRVGGHVYGIDLNKQFCNSVSRDYFPK